MEDKSSFSGNRNIYKVLRLHGVSDMELDEFIETVLVELKILAGYRGFTEVANHLDYAVKATQKVRETINAPSPPSPSFLGVRTKSARRTSEKPTA